MEDEWSIVAHHSSDDMPAREGVFLSTGPRMLQYPHAN
jgi:hypothetical protein